MNSTERANTTKAASPAALSSTVRTNSPQHAKHSQQVTEEVTVEKHNSSSLAKAMLALVCVPLALIVGLCLLINDCASSSPHASTSNTTTHNNNNNNNNNNENHPPLASETTIFLVGAIIVVVGMITIIYRFHATSKNQQCTISSTHIVVRERAGTDRAEETKIPLENVHDVVIRADSLVIETRGSSLDGSEQQEVEIHGVVDVEQVRQLIIARRASSLDAQVLQQEVGEGG